MDDAPGTGDREASMPAGDDDWTVRAVERGGRRYLEASIGSYKVTVPDEPALERAKRDYEQYGAGSRLGERSAIEGHV